MRFLKSIECQIRCRHIQSQMRRRFGYQKFKCFTPQELRQATRNSDFSSQYAQDWFVATRVFPDKRAGFFVDVGANHPTHSNNTLYFEKIGWTGIAFEPQKHLVDIWKTARTTPCLPCVIGSERKTVTFNINASDALSSVVEQNGDLEEQISVEQYRLDDFLQERGISHVDFLSIDVEGYEQHVLQGIDFEKISIRCIVIENNRIRRGDDALRSMIIQNGYDYVARLGCDDVFVRR
ncbi:MAG: FkbM family methyltransferase [Verrucomicrobiota bacterium]